MKFHFILFILLFSCVGKEEHPEEKKPSVEEIPTITKLKGKWMEEKDSLHILEFTQKEMVEFYNGIEINRYATTFFNGLPGEGGYEAVSGRVIQIEESKDNFHHFTIVVLDQHYLELLHRSSASSKFYKRLKN